MSGPHIATAHDAELRRRQLSKDTPTNIGAFYFRPDMAENPKSYWLAELPVIKVGAEGIDESKCNDDEKKPGYIPDPKTLDSFPGLSWDHRTLLYVPELKTGYVLDSRDGEESLD